MRLSILFIAVFVSSLAIAAVEIDLGVGDSITINPGQKTTVNCAPDSSTAGEATLTAFCMNTDDIYIAVDGTKQEHELTLDLNSAAECEAALKQIKPKLGEFTGTKTFMFCGNGDDLIKIKVTSKGEIVHTVLDMKDAAECEAAL